MGDQHLILIGFKSVGKTTIGRLLSEKLRLPFCDLDQEIERAFNAKFQRSYYCRDIVRERGELFFRELETQMLEKVLAQPQQVISVGGGAPMNNANQILLQSFLVIHVTAHKNEVFARIKTQGKPAVFNQDQSMQQGFDELWRQRLPIYQKLATMTLDNSGDLNHTVVSLLQSLKNYGRQ